MPSPPKKEKREEITELMKNLYAVIDVESPEESLQEIDMKEETRLAIRISQIKQANKTEIKIGQSQYGNLLD